MPRQQSSRSKRLQTMPQSRKHEARDEAVEWSAVVAALLILE